MSHAPASVFSASAAFSAGESWAPADPTFHLRVHTHPMLGLPAAPFVVLPGSGEPSHLIDNETAKFTDADLRPFSVNTPSVVPAPEFYVWLSSPSAGVYLNIELPSGGVAIVDVLSPTDPTPLTKRGSRSRRQGHGRPVLIGGSGISLIRVRCPGDAVLRSGGTWEWVSPWVDHGPITTFGLPVSASPGRWFKQATVPTLLDGLGSPAFTPGDPLTEADWRVANGAQMATGPADRDMNVSLGGSLAEIQDAERRRIEVLRRTSTEADLDTCLDQMVQSHKHPLIAPPLVVAAMERGLPTSGGSTLDRLQMRVQDLLMMATLDAGIARWLGFMTPIPDLAPVQKLVLDQQGLRWLPMVVIGLWRVPTQAFETWPGLAALAGSAWNLRLTDPGLLAGSPNVNLDDDPDSGTTVIGLSCAVAAPGIPDDSIPTVSMDAPTGRSTREWIEPSGQGSVRWRQTLVFPRWRPGDPVAGVPAGSRVAIRRLIEHDEVITPTVLPGADPEVVGRGVAWLPRAKFEESPRFVDGGIPADGTAAWSAWVVDEFGRWSDQPTTVNGEPPDLLDPHDPGIQVRFVHSSGADAEDRDGRGHLWVRAAMAPRQPAGTKQVDSLEVTVNGVTTSHTPFDTGWIDRGDDLPVLSRGLAGTVEVTAQVSSTPATTQPGSSQTVDVVDGRIPLPILDPPVICWTSRPTPTGTATLRYANPGTTACTVHLVDEARLRYKFDQGGMSPPAANAPRPDRADYFWHKRDQLAQDDFTVIGRADPGAAVEFTVSGHLGDLLMIKVVAHSSGARPGAWHDSPAFLYAVPESTIPAPPLVLLEGGADGHLLVTLQGAPGALPPARWQLLTCSNPEVDDPMTFLRTTRESDDPPHFHLDVPPWVSVRVAARAALAPERLSDDPDANVRSEWSTTTEPRSWVHVPKDEPTVPTVTGSITAGGTAELEVHYPTPLDPRIVARNSVVVTRHSKPAADGSVAPPSSLPAVDLSDSAGAAALSVTVNDPLGADADAYVVAVRDPAGRVGRSITLEASTLTPSP